MERRRLFPGVSRSIWRRDQTRYEAFATFHPTFLYEALWNVLITVPVILFLESRDKLAKGARFPVYMIVYGMIRFLTELLRTDTTFRVLGISRNGWVSIAAIIAGGILFYLAQKKGSKYSTESAEDQAELSESTET